MANCSAPRFGMLPYKAEGPGPVAEGLFKPLVAEWTSFSLALTEFITEDETVVSLGEVMSVKLVFVVTPTAQVVDEFARDRAFGQAERLAGGTRPVYAPKRHVPTPRTAAWILR